MQPHLLLRLEQAAVTALGDQKLDLLRRVHMPVPGRRRCEAAAAADAAAVQNAIDHA